MLPTHVPTLAIVSVDFSFTSSRMSTITRASSGMISGRHAATAGLRSTKESMSWSAAILDCQNWELKPVKTGPRHARTANSESFAGNALHATSAASRTFWTCCRPRG